MKTQKTIFIVLTLATMLILTSMSTLVTAAPDEYGTQREYLVSLFRSVGLHNEVIGTGTYSDALAKSLGFLDNWNYNPTAIVTDEVKVNLDAAIAPALAGLQNAMAQDPPQPYFVNGLAQPIFYYGNSSYYDTSGEGAARFLVYVETNYDTDGDGKLDLIKVMVQLPRAAVEKGMKVATIYHAQPYNEGTNDGVSYPASVRTEGQNWLNANGPYLHDMLHGTAPPRVPVGEMSTKEAVATARWQDWKYTYSYSGKPATTATVVWGVSNGNQVGSLNLHDYFLVRGYALVSTAGIGTLRGDGISTYGADIEIDAYKCVIDWLNGRAKAYTDKTSNIEIKADWSNGLVGMTGTSYGGTTICGVASSGVEGLETIVPCCGIISYYEYQNQQGAVNWDPQYTPGMVWYILSSFGREDWNTNNPLRGKQMGYMQQMYLEALDLNGNYGEHWARRDYTLDGWYKDWGPSKVHASMLIVHGTNDNNVRPKQSVLMHQVAEKAGVDNRFIWDQGHHMNPSNHQIGAYTFYEWENLWFSYYLYKVDNNVLDMLPGLYAQSNLDGDYIAYDAWETDHSLILNNDDRVRSSSAASISSLPYEEPVEYTDDFYLIGGDNYQEETIGTSLPPAEISQTGTEAEAVGAEIAAALPMAYVTAAAADDPYTTLNSANGSSSWANFLNQPTAGSTLYSLVLPYDATVQGVVEIHFRAAMASVGSNLNTSTALARVHAKLVEIARTGTTLHYYGGNAVGSTISTSTVSSGGLFRGGGLVSSNIVRFTPTTTGTYREIARGWMNLAHPNSGYDSYSSHLDNRINLRDSIGMFHDYTLYLQPTVHTAKAGNRMALILTIGSENSAAYTGNNAFTFTIDNEATYVKVPVAAPLATLTVTFQNDGEIYEKQAVDYQQYAEIPAIPEKRGYSFEGWLTADGEEWDFDTWITSDLTLYANWKKCDFTVYLETEQSELLPGETLLVDVVLEGDINYTMVATELAYDTGMLEYAGYTYLQGWIASVSATGTGEVLVRNMPSMNMVTGQNCSEPTVIATLAFKVKEGAGAQTVLSFNSLLVTPAGSAKSWTIAPDQKLIVSIDSDIDILEEVGYDLYAVTPEEIVVIYD